MIRINSLNKYYNKGRENELHVLRDATVTLPERGMVAIFGKSGCGKTTLLNVIGGLDNYSSGEVELFGENIRKNTDEVRNRYIGYVFQNYNLNAKESCYDNVADALRLCGVRDTETIDSRVRSALMSVGMEKYSKRTPDTLSGGQQQRIAIARAIVKGPRVVLADEPTGNLDEANTVAVMDLLKEISKERLVVIVTHEKKLVDYYCDKVIELSDGRITDVRENSDTFGYSERDKNAVYLGELEKSSADTRGVELEYYGKTPDEPIKLRLVERAGMLYVEINRDKVRLVDKSSEIKLVEGVYEQTPRETNEAHPSIEALSPIEGERLGSLFTFGQSVKAGLISGFANKKRGARAIRRCLTLLAALAVLMSSVFGTSISSLITVNNSYNHNVFYMPLDTTDEDSIKASERLFSAMSDPSSGIDFIAANYGAYNDSEISFRLASFETYTDSIFSESFSTNAAVLGDRLAEGLELVEGERDTLSGEGFLVTTRVADELIRKSSLGYIDGYEDIVGLVASSLPYDISGKQPRVVGVVRSDECAVYLSDAAIVKYLHSYTQPTSYACLDSELGMTVKRGETVLVRHNKQNSDAYPTVGENIMINGVSLRVSEVFEHYSTEDFALWLSDNGYSRLTPEEYFTALARELYPELDPDGEELLAFRDSLIAERLFEYYDYYYEGIDEFLKACYITGGYPDFHLWLFVQKGIDRVKYLAVDETYFLAREYKSVHGEYPSAEELDEFLFDEYSSTLDDYDALYREEYHSLSYRTTPASYLVSSEDYFTVNCFLGNTHPTAKSGSESKLAAVIHSSDPDMTEAWLRETLSEISPELSEKLVTPTLVYGRLYSEVSEDVLGGLVSIGVVFALICICLYFIMRSMMMNEVKEIGIYRAIGVSQRNILFKYATEALTFSSLTVLVGYLVTSVIIWICLEMSPLMADIIYYPVWLALAVLIVLLAASVLFGILPVLLLLRKSPSAILAKYDI